MKRSPIVAAGLVLSAGSLATAANVYLMSSLDGATDSAAATALTSRGHTVTVGVGYESFDGTVNLAGFDTVYLQCNANWTGGLMPVAGQQQLINWVNAGGRLVTSEWVIYYTYTGGGKFETLGQIIPGANTFSYGSLISATYTVVTPNTAINAGVSSPFTCVLTSYTGTETYTTAKAGAITYYSTSNGTGGAGLVGWAVGSGSVFSFTSTCGPDQVADANFGRLFSNVMGATAGGGCYANCDGSTASPALTANDFQCFINKYAANDPYANCDGSTATPSLTANDFQCFINKYAGGCS